MRFPVILCLLLSMQLLSQCGGSDDPLPARTSNTQGNDDDDNSGGDDTDDNTSDEVVVIDTQAPSVVSTNPENGEQNVDVNSNVIITFSEDMDPSTFVKGSTVSMGGPDGDLDFTITVDGAKVTLNPSIELYGSSHYSYNISSDVTDLAGNKLPELGFVSNVLNTKNTPITITNISPSDLEDEVGLDQDIVITFSDNLDPAHLDVGLFKLEEVNGEEVVLSYELSANQITLSHSDDLQELTAYYRLTIIPYEFLSGKRIQSLKRNTVEDITEELYSDFYTEVMSEKYYYTFDGNTGAANDHLKLTHNGGSSYTMDLDNSIQSDNRMWRAIKHSYAGETVYGLTNKISDQNGHNYLIEAAAPDDGNKVLFGGRPSSTTFYTGQLWQFKKATDGYYMYAKIPDAYLNSKTLDIVSTLPSSKFDYQWFVKRRALVDP